METGTKRGTESLGLRYTCSLSVGDHLLYLCGYGRNVKGHTVADGAFDTAAAHGLAVLDLFDAHRREDFQVLERIAVDDDQVCLIADANSSESRFLSEDLGVVHSHMLDDH